MAVYTYYLVIVLPFATFIYFLGGFFLKTVNPICHNDLCDVLLQIRDDNKRQHPCLVDFSKLPETERNYNLQMSTETLK